MKTTSISKDDLLGRNLLSLFIISGIAFSAISFFILNEEMQEIFSTSTEPVPTEICENGLCHFKDSEKTYTPILIQQAEKISKTQQLLKNEDFTNLKLGNNIPIKDAQVSDNTAILFAEKDSFIREGIQNSNEGLNQVLRIMGTGPTNNRILIAFNQEDIKTLSDGKTLETATLKLYVEENNHNWGDGQLINIYKLENNWEEGDGLSAPVSSLFNSGHGVTWDCNVDSADCSKWNGGVFNQTPTDSELITNQLDGNWIKFDVTQDILEYLSTDENFGWIITKSDEESDGQINISSRESSSHNPELVLVFSDD
ncbi:MAG TPA: DNRLRE domain-containing protein [Nitrososphaeraceae archaeon]